MGLNSTKPVFNRLIRIVLFILILGIGFIGVLAANETTSLALNDLPKTPVRAITTAAGSVWYAALQNTSPTTPGFYRSDNQGRTWQAVKSRLDPATIHALAVDPNNSSVLYAGTDGGPLGTNNVWRSEDGGKNWQHFNLSLPAGPNRIIPTVTALVTDPNHPNILYVGTDGQGVYRFLNGQIGYTLVGGASLPAATVRDLLVDTHSRLYALTGQGLYIFTNDKWQHIDTLPEPPVSFAIAPGDPQILYAGTPSTGTYRSTDGGQTWQHIVDGLGYTPGSRLFITALAVDPQNSSHVVAATAYALGMHHLSPYGLYESTTAGEKWVKITALNRLTTQLTFTPQGILAATNEGFQRYQPSPAAGTSSVQLALNRITPVLEQLNNIQLGIIALTLILAALVLLGRLDWLRRR